MRFEFGKNWKNFLRDLDKKKIEEAERSLLIKLKLENLNGYKFLDIGCGSGLFSLAAKNLGAKVTSFDFDFDAVDCAKILKEKYYKDDPSWKIDRGSVLDRNFLNNLGSFDIIYSWGVLHHTGDMWRAIDNVKLISEKNCLIFISIYNYQKYFSSFWTLIKKIYNKFYYLRFFLIFIFSFYLLLPSLLKMIISGKKLDRGMSLFTDLKDWLGGYPFETATPNQIQDEFKKDFNLISLKTVGKKLGCNEFVFKKNN